MALINEPHHCQSWMKFAFSLNNMAHSFTSKSIMKVLIASRVNRLASSHVISVININTLIIYQIYLYNILAMDVI